jgi:hypothetical protein
MPGPSKRKRQATKHPLAPTPDPQEGINPRLEEQTDDDHTETDEEQQARESEKAFDQAITRIPPG